MALRKVLVLALMLAPLFMGLNALSNQRTDRNPDLNSLSDDDITTLVVRLQRTRCYGICPAYKLTIHGDGKVEYEGLKYVKEIGTREGKLDNDRVKALVSEFAKADFIAFSEGYSEAKCSRYCTEMPTAITQVTKRGVTHNVSHYYGCGGAPRALFDLESAIDKSADVEQWTGDVSKAGPFGTTCSNRNWPRVKSAATGRSVGEKVRREKALDFSGCNSSPGTGSFHPVAIETAAEATKLSELLMERVAWRLRERAGRNVSER